MRGATLFLSLTLACLSARSRDALADEGDKRDTTKGLTLGVRTGVGFPVGSTYGASVSGETGSSHSFSGDYEAMVPFIFDIGYRVGRLYFGPWVQYGIAFPSSSSCPQSFQCSVSDVRLGFAGDWHFLRRKTWDPWFGVGFGYEWTTFHASGPSTVDEGLRGFELFDLEAGLDFDVVDRLRVGAFILSSFAQYTDFTSFANNTSSEGKVSDELGQPAPHGWFILGVRGRLDL